MQIIFRGVEKSGSDFIAVNIHLNYEVAEKNRVLYSEKVRRVSDAYRKKMNNDQ